MIKRDFLDKNKVKMNFLKKKEMIEKKKIDIIKKMKM